MRLIDADALYPETLFVGEKPDFLIQKRVVPAEDIYYAPTIDPVKHGLWIQDGFWYDCSVCGHTKPTKWNYCPHCGAKMDGDTK